MSKRACLLASSFITSAALAAALATSASAQAPAAAAAAPAAGNAGEVSAIVVTGTRIPQAANLQSVSPIQTTTSREFQLQGKTDTIELINNLPQVTLSNNVDLSSTSNPLSGPGGVATIDLRGLGPQRTLVLVNGRRLGIGDPNTGNPNPAPDINQVPSQLIDRVDVLTGGASATYGSDAVAGVVNFIMKQNFTGVQVDAQYGTYNHTNDNSYVQGLLAGFPGGIRSPKHNVWDGQSKDVSMAMGFNTGDGKGNVTFYATYHDQDPVSFGRRDFAACQVRVVSNAASCSGSVNSNQFLSADGTFRGTYAVLGNQFVTFSNNNATSPPPRFNSNPFEYLQHQDTRYTAGAFAHYDFDPHLNFYSEFTFMNDKSVTQVAPAGLFEGSGVTDNSGFLINCNNPYLSAQQQGVLACSAADIAAGNTRDLLIGRRNIEGGPRQSRYEHNNYRVVIGAKGDIAGPWKYDIYGSRYYTSLFQLNAGYTSLARTQQALLATRNSSGQIVCTVSSGGCVPYNIFQQGGVTSAQAAYLSENGSEYGNTTESIVEGTITGDLTSYGLKSPWAADGAAVAFGASWRKDSLYFAPDAAILSGDLSGFGGAGVSIDSALSVKELYGEGRIPLAQNTAFAQDLSLEAGYRYSDYSTGISASTFKVGGDWAPVSDIRFRASFQRAIRAPNILELYTPQSVTNTSDVGVDPCAPNEGAPATATLAQCQRTGVTAAQYGNGGSTNIIAQCPAGQCAILQGGNTVLRPEKANTFSVGFTARPSFLRGFIASVDYYHIKITDVIGTIPVDVALENCLSTGNPTFCSLVHRASNGILFGSTLNSGYLVNTNVNVAQLTTSGIDVQLAYNLPLSTFGWDSLGSLSFDLTGTYLLHSKNVPLPGEHEYDCAGLFGVTCSSVNPKWRHNARVTWNTPWNVLASVGWRHTSGVGLESNTNDPTLSSGTQDTTFESRFSPKDYIDLTAIYKVNRMLSLRAGVTNLFDVDPPLVSYLISGTGSPNAFGSYDLLGRRVFVGLTANF